MVGRNTEAFLLGSGVDPEPHCCSECGYTSLKRKHFQKGADDALTCTTGHYTDKDGQMKRARNPYARR